MSSDLVFYYNRASATTICLSLQFILILEGIIAKLTLSNFLFKFKILFVQILFVRPIMSQEHKAWLYTRKVLGSISTRKKEIFNVFFSPLWCRGKARCWVSTLNAITLNACRIRQKWATECFNTTFTLPAELLYVECNGMTLKKNLYNQFRIVERA